MNAQRTAARGLVLGLLILAPTLAIRLVVLLVAGVLLDLWGTYVAVGLCLYVALRLHQAGHRNPIGRVVTVALSDGGDS